MRLNTIVITAIYYCVLNWLSMYMNVISLHAYAGTGDIIEDHHYESNEVTKCHYIKDKRPTLT